MSLTSIEVVISVGPIYTEAEQRALYGRLPAEVSPLRVVIDAPLAVTWERARSDSSRRLSRQRDFHVAAHTRYRSLLAGIPTDLMFNSGDMAADEIATAISRAVGVSESGSSV